EKWQADAGEGGGAAGLMGGGFGRGNPGGGAAVEWGRHRRGRPPSAAGAAPADAAIQEHLAWIPGSHGHAPDRWPQLRMGRFMGPPACDPDLREPGAGVLGRSWRRTR